MPLSLPWWRTRRDDLLALAATGTPRYVYSRRALSEHAARLRAAVPADRALYAVKANSHPEVIATLAAQGLDPECVSIHEVEHVLRTLPDLPPARILYTPNFAPRVEVERAAALGVQITLDNATLLTAWPDLWAGRDLFVRVDPGTGKGHHAHVRTAGDHSKFGIAPGDLPEVARAATALGARVIGLHAHVGSGVDETQTWATTARTLAAHADAHFPEVRTLDVGGGLPVATGGATPFDLEAAGRALAAFRSERPAFAVWVEPGRFLVAEAGVLLARVTQTKDKGDVPYVGLDAGMNTLVRPALYGAHHDIYNLTRIDEAPASRYTVVGPICESGDAFGTNMPLPLCREGDVVLIDTAGAYGAAMSSRYNLRPLAEETMLDG
jgi:diaminopimelate decarboxylase/aspartate kinase